MQRKQNAIPFITTTFTTSILSLGLAVAPAWSQTPPPPANVNADRDFIDSSSAPYAMRDLLAGDDFPLALKLRDLDKSWRRINVGGQQNLVGMMQLYSAVIGSMAGGNMAGVYYTRGQMVTSGGENYLVAYRTQPDKPIDFEALSHASKPPVPDKLAADSVLRLSLLNLRSIGNLDDIRPFNLDAELGRTPQATEATKKDAVAEANAATDANLKQLGTGLLMYMQDFDESLPPMESYVAIRKPLTPYVKDAKIFLNPSTNKPLLPNPALSRKKMAHIVNGATMVAFYEEPAAADGTRGLVFLDGHSKRIQEKEWPQVARNSKVFGGKNPPEAPPATSATPTKTTKPKAR